MAAPSGTQWGSIVNSYGRIGIYTSLSSTSTQTTVSGQIWFWSKYSVDDARNTLYFSNNSTSAERQWGYNFDINHTVDSGSGWSTSNQTKLANFSYTYNRTASNQTIYCAAKFTGIDAVGTMTVVGSYTIPGTIKYMISYNANGGTGAPSSQTKEYDVAITLSSTKPTRTGYSFLGWSTSSTATSASYSPGATYSTNADLALYAVWKAYTYTISYDANGGSGAPSSQTKTYGVTLTLSSTIPTRTNYIFKGWSTFSVATTATYSAGGSFTSNANTTLYAVWGAGYVKPRITNLSAYRCDSSGNSLDTGAYYRAIFNWETDYSVSSITFQLRLSTSSSWLYTTDMTSSLGASGTSGSVDIVITSSEISAESSYVLRITVTDSNGSTSNDITIPGASFLIDFKSGGNGVAIGKPAESDNLFDVKFPAKFNSTLSIGDNKVLAKRCCSALYSNSTTKPWYKFASISCSYPNEDRRISFKVTGGYNTGTVFGILNAYIRTDASGTIEGAKIWMESVSGGGFNDLIPSDFVLAYSGAEAELWVKLSLSWFSYQFEVLSETTRDHEISETWEEWTLYNYKSSNGYAASPTDGYTQITAADTCIRNVSEQQVIFATEGTNYVGFYKCGNGNWLRAPSNGIIPNSSVSDGTGSLGASTWPFANIFAIKIYEGGTLLKNKYLLQSGGTVSGYFQVNNICAAIGYYRFYGEWIGFYASTSDATNATNRKGWIGFDTTTNFSIINQAGGSNITSSAWTTSSDKRLKKDINDIPEVFIDVWKILQPKVFKWNDLNGGGDKYQFGLIAQDVIEAFERYGLDYRDYGFIVPYTNKGIEYFTVTYDHYHMLTSMVLKQTNDRLEEQQKQIDSLQSQIDELKRLIKEE